MGLHTVAGCRGNTPHSQGIVYEKERAVNLFWRAWALGYSVQPLSRVGAPVRLAMKRHRTQDFVPTKRVAHRTWESRLAKYRTLPYPPVQDTEPTYHKHFSLLSRTQSGVSEDAVTSRDEQSDDGSVSWAGGYGRLPSRFSYTIDEHNQYVQQLQLKQEEEGTHELLRMAFTRFHNVPEARSSLAFLGERNSFHIHRDSVDYAAFFFGGGSNHLNHPDSSDDGDSNSVGYNCFSPATEDFLTDSTWEGFTTPAPLKSILPSPPPLTNSEQPQSTWVTPTLATKLFRAFNPTVEVVGSSDSPGFCFNPFSAYRAEGVYMMDSTHQEHDHSRSWCHRTLLLRQNFLFEYDFAPPSSAPTSSCTGRGGEGMDWSQEPIGCAILCGAVIAQPSDKVLRVECPTSAGDQHTFLIHCEDVSIATALYSLLQAASILELESVYELHSNRASRSGSICDVEKPSIGGGGGPASAPLHTNTLRHCSSWRAICNATLGQGRTAYVRKARRHGPSGSVCALKLFDKEEFVRCVGEGLERADALLRETLVNCALTSACTGLVSEGGAPPIVRLLGVVETADTFALEMELMSSMNLFNVLSEMGTLEEPVAAKVVKHLLHCVALCQESSIAHRDIKLSNILCTASPTTYHGPHTRGGADESGSKWVDGLRLCDFGMAAVESPKGYLSGRCGTPGYVAPEILSAGPKELYANTVDIYSVGVVAYTLLCGYEPFFAETNADLITQNLQGDFEFDSSGWDFISMSAQDLVASLMEKDPCKRISAQEALNHPWIRSGADDSDGTTLCGSLDSDSFLD